MNNIRKIISGGQTGADRGGLDAAIELGIPHGGWCPKGRMSEDGKTPEKYKLEEMNSKDYLKRTEQNVIESDATIIFTYGKPTGGSKRTVEFAKKHGRPYLWIDPSNSLEDVKIHIKDWLEEFDKKIILNVGGSRESKAKGIEKRVKEVLIETLR